MHNSWVHSQSTFLAGEDDRRHRQTQWPFHIFAKIICATGAFGFTFVDVFKDSTYAYCLSIFLNGDQTLMAISSDNILSLYPFYPRTGRKFKCSIEILCKVPKAIRLYWEFLTYWKIINLKQKGTEVSILRKTFWAFQRNKRS